MPRGIYKRSEDQRKKLSDYHKGKIPWNKGKKGLQIAWNKGLKWPQETKDKISSKKISRNKHMTEEEKQHLSCFNKRIGKSPPAFQGEKHYNWQGGKSFEVYPIDWNDTLKRAIRERDKYRCQICGEAQGDTAHHVHHIDYNKKNCNPKNLITLCVKCHRKTGDNRDTWIVFFGNKEVCNSL